MDLGLPKTGKVLRKLFEKCFKPLKYVFNAIIRTCPLPNIWKIAQNIIISKHGKELKKVPPTDL